MRNRISVARAWIKGITPKIMRDILRCWVTYFQRLSRWPIILWQVRGKSFSDGCKLLASAIASPITSFRKIKQWQDPVLLCDATVYTRGVGTFRVRARTDDLWHVLPWREKAIFQFLHKKLRSGSVFVDVGANIGVYTVLASRLVGPVGQVVAFEMIPETAKILRRHVEMNNCGNVRIFYGAVSERDGDLVEASIPEGSWGQASIQRRRGESVLRVPTLTLKKALEDINRIDLMKMDIEGAELAALNGLGDDLLKVRSIIFESRGNTAVERILESRGFTINALDGNNAIAISQDR